MSFKYICTQCNGRATKQPVSKYDPVHKTGGTLGTWHCADGCRGKVKVKRKKAGENA